MTTLYRNLPTVFLLLLLPALARAELKPGDPFPAAALAALGGTTAPVTGKILVVDFWASWCAPCKASFPALGRIAGDFGPRGVVLLGVSVDESPAAYAAFVKKFAPPFATAHDARHELARQVGIPAMPSTFLIGRDGRIRAVHAGFHGEASERQLRNEIESMLSRTD